MKVKDTYKEIEKSEGFQSSSYKIKASAKAFDILSSRLYTNVVLAIVRELSTNALDAHIAAGRRTTPFEINLPTHEAPYFQIRDYGTGLSKNSIENLYTTYFDSDKTDSNEFTGALGLGSKSPFSYGDSFTVTSYYHGEKYVYSMYKEKGMPKIIRLLEEKTSLPDGLEIKLGVKAKDFETFKREAGRVFEYFPVKPIFNEDTAPTFLEKKVYLSGDSWRIFCKEREPDLYSAAYYKRKNTTLKPSAIMGHIGYPIQKEYFKNEHHQALLTLPLWIDFNLGELEMSANREELHYNEETIEAIKNKLDGITQELCRKVEGQISGAKSLWQAKIILSELLDKDQTIGAACSLLFESKQLAPIWNGKKVQTNSINPSEITKIHAGIRSFEVKRYDSRARKAILAITPSKETQIIIDDVSVGAITRTQDYLRKLKSSQEASKRREIQAHILTPSTGETQELLDLIGLEVGDYILASSFPKKTRAVGIRIKGCSETILQLIEKPRNCSPYSEDWKKAEEIPEEEKVFLSLSRFRPSLREGHQTERQQEIALQIRRYGVGWTKTAMEKLNTIQKCPENIYGIRTKDTKTLKKTDGWIHIIDFIDRAFTLSDQRDEIWEERNEYTSCLIHRKATYEKI